MKIYNTMTNSIEDFRSLEKGKVRLYVCGPTVYNYIHIGNARPVIVFDVLARYFKYIGYEVEYVQNFTDVDDKIIKKSIEEGVSPKEISEKYIKSFFEDIKPLNILPEIKRPKVTENINEIIETVKKLIEKGYAYEMEGNVFFDVKKYKEYGKLSNQKTDELEIGARVNIMEIKKNPLDFALWKKKKEGEPFWKSPWGDGRPGWHIECSAMSRKYLGASFDIHGGGQDLIFPHHENEIAQSRCAYGGNFANYWMHNGFILMEGEKMSKSSGNFFLMREILEKFSGNVIKLFVIGTHYRKPLNFSFSNMEDAKNTLHNIAMYMKKFEDVINGYDKKDAEEPSSTFENDKKTEFLKEIEKYNKKFMEAMDDDMNTPKALSVIFEQLKATSVYMNRVSKFGSKEIFNIKFSYRELKIKLEDVLGIIPEEKNKKLKNSDELTGNLIELLIKLRGDARKEKNFKLSDEIRDRLKDLKISLKDNRDGSTDYIFEEKEE